MKFRKVMAIALVAAMAAGTMAGCGNTTGGETTTTQAEIEDYGTGELVIWVSDATTELTKTMVADFMAENPKMAGYTVTVQAVGEGDAASNMITDVEGGADIYVFAQDQIARLVSAGALTPVTGDNLTAVKTNNDAGAVGAATVGETVFAYPMTSDNGYFMYYDKSVVKDPSTLEGVIADCESANKNFYMELNSGWYQTAFFFATGCKLEYTANDDGAFVSSDITYASDAGVIALKEMIELASSTSFQNGSSVSNGTNIGAIVDGTWDSEAAKELFGDNYACAKLPTFTGSDGKSYQLSGFGGFKLLGVKPQTDAKKLAVCNAVANYLSGEKCQMTRFENVGWGPSNKNAQSSDAVQNDPALSALAEQLAYTIPQGNYPGDYWTLATSLGDDVVSTGVLTSSTSDADLLKALQQFQDTCASYAK